MMYHNPGRGIRREVKGIRLNNTATIIEQDKKHAETMKAAAERRKQNAEKHKRKMG